MKFGLLPIATLFAVLLTACYDHDVYERSSSITLRDKSVSIIRANIQGKWKLLYVQGGISGGTFPVRNNPYMTIRGDHVTISDDRGVTLDTVIVWKRGKDIFNEYTFFMTFANTATYEIVNGIQHDTLTLIDDAYDGFESYYLRVKSP